MEQPVRSVHAPTLLAPLIRDAQSMLTASFASAADIDTAMRLGAGHPAGPFAYAASLPFEDRLTIGDIAAPSEGDGAQPVAEPDVWSGPIGVVGTGQMASGIVECIATSGTAVVVLSRSYASSGRIRAAVGRSLDRACSRGRISFEDAAAALASISFTCNVEDLAPAQLVIEAVAEDLAIKHQVLARLDATLRPGAIIATNTSSFRVAEVRVGVSPARDVIALHFFNPAPAMRLLEVVTASSDSAVTEKALSFAAAIGKTAATCGDERGFIVNRLLIPYLNDAVALVDDGVPAQDVDAAVKSQAFHPMGPLELIDLIGVDVTIATLISLHEATGDARMKPHRGLISLSANGHLGRKSGRGFFSYDH